jgi:hypothetical protein
MSDDILERIKQCNECPCCFRGLLEDCATEIDRLREIISIITSEDDEFGEF